MYYYTNISVFSSLYDFNIHTLTNTHYYPFGMETPGRKFNSNSYKFGFNGKLKDDEVYGEGNFQDYGMRMYDTRVCRFISVDPLFRKYPELTPYQFASNNPISGIDLDGKEWFGCTSLVNASISGIAGIGYGINLSIQVGNAYDMLGTTQYIAYKAISPLNQDLEEGTINPQFLLGGGASVDIGVNIVGEPTFAKAFQDVSYSMTKVSLKPGFGGSGSVSKKGGGVSVGFGIGGHFETGNNTKLIQSISITNEERKNTTLGSVWIVGDKVAIKNDAGKIIKYSALLYELTMGSNIFKLTGLTVYSDAVKEEVKDKTTGKIEKKDVAKGNWKTEKYKKEEATQ